jgi:hypothetical protein
MEYRQANSGLQIQGRIDAQVHNAETLANQVDREWDDLSDKEKMQIARDTEPDHEQTVYNVTTERFHQYIVDNLDPAQTAVKDNVDASWMALGTDAASGTAVSDTDLNSRTYSETVTDHADNSNELLASTFLDSTEGNGNTFDEIGLFTGDPANLANAEVFMINHATFGGITKDDTNTITFDVTLTFSDV